MSDGLTKIDSVADVTIYSVAGEPKSFVYKAGMAIDCDGSPRAYGPNNSGIDFTANGGTPGSNWWGGPTDSSGNPIVQKIYEPQPGMYVSGTSHINPAFAESSQYCYMDAEAIPFIVLPGQHSNGAKLGDVCLVLNTATGDNCYGIYGDVGPSSKIGEASMRMASALKINSDPKKGGIESKVIAYLVFPGSVASWKPPDVWWDVANTVFKAWGTLDKLKQIAAKI